MGSEMCIRDRLRPNTWSSLPLFFPSNRNRDVDDSMGMKRNDQKRRKHPNEAASLPHHGLTCCISWSVSELTPFSSKSALDASMTSSMTLA